MICPYCNEDKKDSDFFKSQKSKNSCGYCKSCHNESTKIRQQKLKAAAIEYLGGKCEECGITGHPAIFDFHHKKPSEKDFNISKKGGKLESIINELNKCKLLCGNCHKITNIIENSYIDKNIIKKPIDIINSKTCKKCFVEKDKTEFFDNYDGTNTKSTSCKKCHRKKLVERKNNNKKLAIEYMGGKCIKCNVSSPYINVFEFHHINSNEKEYKISTHREYSFERLKLELDKCELLCTNCHRLEHVKYKYM